MKYIIKYAELEKEVKKVNIIINNKYYILINKKTKKGD